jgi:hypothetical protein
LLFITANIFYAIAIPLAGFQFWQVAANLLAQAFNLAFSAPAFHLAGAKNTISGVGLAAANLHKIESRPCRKKQAQQKQNGKNPRKGFKIFMPEPG